MSVPDQLKTLVVATTLAVLALVGAPPRAHAHAMPLAVKSALPADGSTFAAVHQLPIEVKTDTPPPTGTIALLEVSTQPSPLGQDGTLPNEFLVLGNVRAGLRSGFFTRGDAYLDTYSATYLYPPGNLPPGTYYWQMTYENWQSSEAVMASPIYRFVVMPPAVPPPTPHHTTDDVMWFVESVADARQEARSELADKYGRAFRARRGFRLACRRIRAHHYRCSTFWRFRRFRYSGKVLVSETPSDLTTRIRVKRRAI